MATAYAAVTSLMGTIRLIISQSSVDLQEGNNEHLKLLNEKLGPLLKFLDNNFDGEKIRFLHEKLKDLAQGVEDEIESHVQREAQETLLKTLGRVFHLPIKNHTGRILQRAIRDIDSFTKELFEQSGYFNLQAGKFSREGYPLVRHFPVFQGDLVGRSAEVERMLDQLTRQYSSQQEVISVVGMAGIGKTSFAAKMFSDPAIISFFDVRGWTTVSKDYDLRGMLLDLLRAAGVNDQNLYEVSDTGELADRLQKSLKGRRYLIVLDDVWSTEVWDEIKMWFPEYNNGSRILLTTRDMNVAQFAGSHDQGLFPMHCLGLDESWELFSKQGFPRSEFPIEFKNAAEEILKKCKGLPLRILEVVGILRCKYRTSYEWRRAVGTIELYQYVTASTLALSYNNLPLNSKACFLYFGVFQKSSEISVKKLIRLWVAEGLLELKGLEEFDKEAANILHDFIDKSLIIVSKRSLNGKIKACRVHDLVHDLCVREAETGNILYVVDPKNHDVYRKLSPAERCRWVSVHSSASSSLDITRRKIRSLHFSFTATESLYNLRLSDFKLLRVLDMEAVVINAFPTQILDLVCLRYVALRVVISICIQISSLWNLQTFVVHGSTSMLSPTIISLPHQIWEMSHLRHLHSTRMNLSSPRKVSAEGGQYPVLNNLQSVSGLSPRCCTETILQGMRKVKKLGISGNKDEFCSQPKCLDNLTHLHELETLNITSFESLLTESFFRLPCSSSFPPNLKQLTLYHTYLQQEDMGIVGQLLKLEVLKLKAGAFVHEEWEVTEAEFPDLKSLLLENLHLQYWRAPDDSFPCLERVIIRSCSCLEEIPKGFAESTTLQLIELHCCSPSLVTFAEQIQEEQEEMGNNILKVVVFDTKEPGPDVGREEMTEDDDI